MSEFLPLWAGGPCFAMEKGAPLGTDSILLADFARPGTARRGIDLGCGSGILSLLLLERTEALHMTGLELRPEAARLAEENLSRNGFASRSTVLAGDLREHRRLFAPGSFDLVIANPPYFPQGSGAMPPDPDRAAARSEIGCSLEELCSAAAWLLPSGGRFFLVHRPERLVPVLCAMCAAGLEPKRMRLVSHQADHPPSLALIEGRRGGRPGLKLEAPLVLWEKDGSENDEVRRIYHR